MTCATQQPIAHLRSLLWHSIKQHHSKHIQRSQRSQHVQTLTGQQSPGIYALRGVAGSLSPFPLAARAAPAAVGSSACTRRRNPPFILSVRDMTMLDLTPSAPPCVKDVPMEVFRFQLCPSYMLIFLDCNSACQKTSNELVLATGATRACPSIMQQCMLSHIAQQCKLPCCASASIIFGCACQQADKCAQWVQGERRIDGRQLTISGSSSNHTLLSSTANTLRTSMRPNACRCMGGG